MKMKKIIAVGLCLCLISGCFVNVSAREKTPLELAKEKVIITPTGQIRGNSDDIKAYKDILLTYIDAPESDECVDILKEAGMYSVHPRIWATEEDFVRIKGLVETDWFTELLYRKQKEYTDAMIAKPIVYFADIAGGSESARATTYSREIQDRAVLLGMLWQMTGDMKYVEYAEKQLEQGMKDSATWISTLALQNAEISVAMAVAYDWMYDGFSQEFKDKIKNYLITKMTLVKGYYDAGAETFTNQVNNWNSVCNGSYGLTALVLLDEEPELCSNVLSGATKAITLSMDELAPNGGFPEGPGYWSYQVEYLQYFISALDTALKTDFKISEFPGFKETAFFPMYVSSPINRAFNYADVDEGGLVTYHFYWFADKFGFDGLSAFADKLAPSGTDFSGWEAKSTDTFIMLWRNPSDKDPYEGLPEGNVYYGRNQVATMRSRWGDYLATFVGFKGGNNQISHGNLDIGSFVLDSLGTRWVNDIGKEDYGLDGYWDYDKGRWQVYTQRAESHNTIVINPSKEADQNPYAKAEIIDFQWNEGSGYGVVDMTDAYKTYSNSVIRGFALCGDTVIVRDEISLKEESDVLWGITTTADIEISANKKDATLTLFNKKMKVSIISPANATFDTMPAQSVALQKKAREKNTDKYKRLITRSTYSGNVDITVQFSAYNEGEFEPDRFSKVYAIDNWSEGNIFESDGIIKEILLDGIKMSDFNPSKLGYTIPMKSGEKIPSVDAVYDPVNSSIAVEWVGNVAKISAVSRDPRLGTMNYTFNFEKEKVFSLPKGYEEIKIVDITASDDGTRGGTSIPGVNDGRLDTRWAAEGEQWIMFDLGEKTPLKIVFHRLL